jgi:hypothetical protein
MHVDTDEATRQKKIFFKEKQFNDDSTHFLSSPYTCMLILVVGRLAIVTLALMAFSASSFFFSFVSMF